MLEEILAYNKQFVENKGYESYITNKYPDKKIAILSCMDTRLTALLPAALGIKNGDVKMIKNAGGVISHPFGSVIRSLLVAIFELYLSRLCIAGISFLFGHRGIYYFTIYYLLFCDRTNSFITEFFQSGRQR